MELEFKPANELAPVVDALLDRLFVRLRALVPQATLHHIGATAIAGALTKGDVDILMQVVPDDFPRTVEALAQNFSIKQPQNWTATFASFGDEERYPLPVGVQLVVKDSRDDFFLFLRDYLRTNPEVLREYNCLKEHHADGAKENYWKAKDEFFQKILIFRTITLASGHKD